MPHTPFHHPYRIDAPTLSRAENGNGISFLLPTSQLPNNVRFVSVNPAVFTHAYLLLGEHPQRFVNDLSLYLSTIRTFFERADVKGGISVPADANPDSRRRLSEDLGVALAAYFMVKIFGITWESISQIPQNSKLSKKRPDFSGYSTANQRYLFEAKGTTRLLNVEKALSKALSQVKNYPEPAEAKIAIISYLSADERFFPSTSFVVDPPALPDGVKSDVETSRLLHFEKVLQFAGLPQTAKGYMAALEQKLRDQHRGGPASPRSADRYSTHLTELKAHFSEEAKMAGHEKVRLGDTEFVGRFILDDASNPKIFAGANSRALEAGIELGANTLETRPDMSVNEIESYFSDGTLLRISGIRGNGV